MIIRSYSSNPTGQLKEGSAAITGVVDYTTVLELNTSGVLHYLFSYNATESNPSNMKITIDGVLVASGYVSGIYGVPVPGILETVGGANTVLTVPGKECMPINIPFKRSLKIEVANPYTSTINLYWLYSLIDSTIGSESGVEQLCTGSGSVTNSPGLQTLLDVKGRGTFFSISESISMGGGYYGQIKVSLDDTVVIHQANFGNYADYWCYPIYSAYINTKRGGVTSPGFSQVNMAVALPLSLPFYKNLKIEALLNYNYVLSLKWSYSLFKEGGFSK